MSRLHARIQRLELERQQQAAVARALRESAPVRGWVTSTGADPQRLRGIPAIGRSVSGAIRGTDPERAVVR